TARLFSPGARLCVAARRHATSGEEAHFAAEHASTEAGRRPLLPVATIHSTLLPDHRLHRPRASARPGAAQRVFAERGGEGCDRSLPLGLLEWRAAGAARRANAVGGSELTRGPRGVIAT